MKNKTKYIVQGDVSFHPIGKIPDNLKKVEHDGTFIVALGEATNHAHRVIGDFDLFQDEQGRHYFSIKGKTEIEHYNTITQSPAEHKTLPFEIGEIYKGDFEDDYNPFTEELKRSVD